MSLRYRIASYLAIALLAVSCGGPQAPGGGKPFDRVSALGAAHPRLLITAEVRDNLRAGVTSTHKWLWERYLQDLPGRLESAARPIPENLNRGHGDLAPALAFTWLITGDGAQLQTAKMYLLKLAETPEWDPADDLIHGHLLQGMALAYDWLYLELSTAEREKIAGRLGQACEREYESMTTGRVWYRNQYFQNHGLSNFCGMAYAACALWGEHPDAEKWLAGCEDYYRVVVETLPQDGTSLEGVSYGAYDYEYLWRFVELSHTLLGKDYTDTPGLKNFPAWVLHSMLPAQSASEWAMTFGDAPRHVNWH
ncbi:MAG TPA: DUF4962 domain-containing protein, partial [Candidatus Glassbacteria bacterium]|nr:DUF4962 domain-containing protein [Candidatus Glassbacteria bacterium]